MRLVLCFLQKILNISDHDLKSETDTCPDCLQCIASKFHAQEVWLAKYFPFSRKRETPASRCLMIY